MKEINSMNVKYLSACRDEREPSQDKIGEMLKKRKFKREESPELALYEVYSIRLTKYEQPQSLIMAGAGMPNEKQTATDKVTGPYIDPSVEQGVPPEDQGHQGAEKLGSTGMNLPLTLNSKAAQKEVSSLHPGDGERINKANQKTTWGEERINKANQKTTWGDERINKANQKTTWGDERLNEANKKITDSSAEHKDAFPLRPGRGDSVNEAGRGLRREPLNEKSIAGSAGVLHPSALKEPVLHKGGPSSEISRKALAQRDHYETEKTSVKSEEMLKYHFRKWGGDHSVTIKENGAGNTLLRPSDEYVSYRLDQALKERGESMWLLDDDSGEHKYPHHDPDDGDEDD